MKQLVFCFALLFAFTANTQTPFMVCKPGGYSNEDLKNFLFEKDQDSNLVLKQTRFVENYASQSVRIINEGYEHCNKDYRITTEDLVWVIDNSYVENLEMKSFVNSKKVEDDIIFFRDTFTGGVRIHEYDGCRVAWMKDTCANLIEYQLPSASGVVQNKKPAFVGNGDGITHNGGKEPDVSKDVVKNTESEKRDTTWIPEVGPIVTSSGKKPTSWQQEEYEKQQKEKQQSAPGSALDSLAFVDKGGNYISNSFNTTTYVLPGGSQSQDDSNGQYVYYRGSWVPASHFTDLSWYSGPIIGFNAGVRFLWGVNNYSYCPTGIPYHAYWDGKNVRSAIDPRTLQEDNRGNWEYTRSLSADEWRNSPQNTTYRGGTTGVTRDSWHPDTHQRPVQRVSSRYYGSRRGT